MARFLSVKVRGFGHDPGFRTNTILFVATVGFQFAKVCLFTRSGDVSAMTQVLEQTKYYL